MYEEITFYLPLGLKTGNHINRKGTMRAMTAEDELMLQDIDGVNFNDRIRDLELLSRLITSLGDLKEVGTEELENLYECDFIYLQMLFNVLNREDGALGYTCPACGELQRIDLTRIFINPPADGLKEDYGFHLPQGRGFTPEMGTRVRGRMAPARCRDFIALHHDSRCRENASWFYVGLLSRCVKQLDSIKSINNSVIIKLSPLDFSFLIDLFNEINNGPVRSVKLACLCGHEVSLELILPGEP